jgi:hypothetical protein
MGSRGRAGLRSLSSLLVALKDALAEGQLTNDDVLEAAVHLSPRFRRWLREHVSLSAEAHRRAGTKQSLFRPNNQLIDAAVARGKEIVCNAGLAGVEVIWGLKVVHRRTSRVPCVVFLVQKKKREHNVAPRERLPPKLEVMHCGTKVEIPTDVREVPKGHFHGTARPGFYARVIATEEGSLSCGLTLDDGTAAVMISGHVADGFASTVTAIDQNNTRIALGPVKTTLRSQAVDAALVAPVDAGTMKALTTGDSTIRDLSNADIPCPIKLRLPGGSKSTSVTGCGEAAVFDNHYMSGLLKLNGQVTSPGDSGSPAFDGDGTLIGFVLGAAGGNSYLQPGRTAIDALTK